MTVKPKSRFVALALVVVLLLFLPQLGLQIYWQRQIELIAIYTLLVSGLNLTFGYAGELALGQVATLAGGAYTAAILTSHGHSDLILDFVCSIVVAVVLGLIVGIPGLRLTNWSLGLVSLFLLLIVPNILDEFSSQTGGAEGLPGIIDPTVFGQSLGNLGFYEISIVVMCLWIVVARNAVTSPYGAALGSLRQSGTLARSLGLSVTRLKLTTYVLGNVPAGLAGCLYAFYSGYVTPVAFNFSLAVALLAASILGGSASIYGAPLGAALLVLGPLRTTSFNTSSTLIYGLFLVFVGLVFRGGFARVGHWVLAWIATRIVRPDRTADAPVAESSELKSLPGDVLTVDAVTKSFGGVDALSEVSLRAVPGAVTAVIGPNGAGKTTLLNAICGYFPIDAGSLTLGEDRLARRRPNRVASLGVSRTFQTPRIQTDMTALEVAATGAITKRWPSWYVSVLRLPGHWRALRSARARAAESLAICGLDTVAGTRADSLPLGTRRLLEVARSVVSSPRLILLDEPAAGLDEHALRDLESTIRFLCASGATVVLVEHNVPFVMDLAAHVVVLEFGKVIATGTPAEIVGNQRVRESYLGRQVDLVEQSPAPVKASFEESERGGSGS